MPVIGSAQVNIRATDKFFERDVRAAVKKIKNVAIDLQADVNLTKVNKKLADLRYRMRNNIIQLNIQAPQVEEVEKNFQKIVDTFDGKTVSLRANADTLRAETQMALATRDRQAKIKAVLNSNIDAETEKALKGLFYTLTGSIPFDKIKTGLLALAGNFEMITLKGFTVVSVISALSASLFSLAGSAFTIGRDLTDVIGLSAALPAGMFLFGTAIAAATISWKGFSDAVGGDQKALAKLPIQAQEAALALKGLGTEIARPVKEAFWVALDGSLQSMVKTSIPSLKEGLSGAATAVGNLTREGFQSIEKFIKSGGLDTMFDRSNQGLQNMARGIDPVVTAFGKLGEIGSKFLPRFGDWLADLGEKFGNFIDQQSEATITGWIEDAITTIKLLSSSVADTARIFSGISDAATAAGFGGLRAFSDGLKKAADVANREPFKSQLTNIFEAAGDAVEVLSGSVGNLFKTLGKASQELGGFFREGSGVVAAFIDNITSMLENSNFLSGMLTGLSDFRSAVQTMEPGFIRLGDIIGNIGIIAGEVFTAMAPGFNQIMDTLAGVFDGLTPGLVAVIPVFNEFVQSVLLIASGPIVALAEGVGAFLTFFSQLPPYVTTVVTALGAMILLRPKLEGLFSGMATSFATARQRMDGDVEGLSRSQQKMYGHFGAMRGHLSSVSAAIHTIPFAAMTSGMGGVATSVGSATGSLGKAAGKGFLGAISGGAALLGGPWGIALAGGIALISAYGQAQADSEARVAAFSQTLDKQTGHISNATKSLVATTALDGATNAWDDFVRGVLQGSASVEELLGRMGVSTKEYTDKLADPSGRDKFVQGFQDISDALLKGKPITDEMAAAIGATKEELKGITSDEFDYLADKAGGAAAELNKAEKQVKALAEATGLTSARATVLQNNFEVLGKASSSASEKFTALKSNLDILSKGMQSTSETRKQFAQSMSDSSTALKDLSKEGTVNLDALYKVGEGFDFATQSGRDFHTTLGTATDAILKNGTAALDQALKGGKSVAEANSIAIQAMQPGVQALRDQLKSLGVEQPKIDDIIRSFGLMPDQIATAITVEGTEEAQRKIFLTKVAADSFSNGNYKAVLAALPEEAKKAIADATGKGKEFAEGDYESVLKAFDGTAGGREAALAAILSTTNGNYSAALRAWDDTATGRAAAQASMAGFASKEWQATIKAKADEGSLWTADRTLQGLADKPRYATIFAQVKAVGRNAGLAAMQDGIDVPASANGSIMNKAGKGISGFNPGKASLKAFASGGIEKHVAQIAKGGSMRLWAEPETGGEAYIPLAKAKRERSLKILEEVARIFGFGLHSMKFENGGVERQVAVPQTSSSGSGGPNVAFNVYPSAGLNEEQTAKYAMDELYWNLTNK